MKWHRLNIGGIQMLDVGLAMHEHDLIVALTACVSSPVFPSFEIN